jgi:hypothetical protein
LVQSHRLAVLALLTVSILVSACSADYTDGSSQPASPMASPSPTPLRAADTTWAGPFATTASASGITYCLMGSGYFQAPTSDEFDSIVSSWTAAHPDATLTEVAKIDAASDEGLVYVWLTDGESNLNLDLVRQGACPGGTMVPFDLTSLLIDKQRYVQFEKELRDAQRTAKRERLGVWE